MSEGNPNIRVEITDATELHCFRLLLNPQSAPEDTAPRIEVMFHARSLVDLIHKCSSALCDWQKATTDYLLDLPRTGPRTDQETIAVLRAAQSALLSYQFGNSAPALAEEVGDALGKVVKQMEQRGEE